MNTFKALTIDKLELCYRGSVEMHEYLQTGESIVTTDFELYETGRSISSIRYNVTYTGNEFSISHRALGSLRIVLGQDYETEDFRYVWFELYNETLYSVETQNVFKDILLLFSQQMGITLNNVTKFELAFDAEENLGNIINSIYTSNLCTPIVAGKAYGGDEFIPHITRECWGTRLKPTLIHWRIKAKKGCYQLYCYDKLQEIPVHEKQYILDYYHRKSFSQLWRLEVRADKKTIQDILTSRRITWDEFLYIWLFSDEGRLNTIEIFSKNLLRFRFGRKEIYSVYQWCDRNCM